HERHDPIFSPLPLSDGNFSTCKINIRELQIDQLTHAKACLEKEHHNGQIPAVPPCYLQQSLVLCLEEYRRVPLFPDWSFNRVGWITKDNLVVFEKFEKPSDRRELSFPGDGRSFAAGQVVNKLHNVYPRNPVRDIEVNPACFEPLDKLPDVPQVWGN